MQVQAICVNHTRYQTDGEQLVVRFELFSNLIPKETTMTKRSLVLAMSLLAAVLVGAALANLFRASDAHAQLRVSGNPWEYAALTGVRTMDEPHAEICVFTETGCEQFLAITATDTKNLQGTATQNAIAKAVHAMGAAGWEMVGGADVPVTAFDAKKHSFVTDDHRFQVFFKRRKP